MSAQPVIFDALAELRAEIEEAAADGTASVEQRTARLLEFRSDLMDLLGAIDTYVGDNRIEQTPEPTPLAVSRLRENADIREALVEAGRATEEDCDALMLYGHEQLDELAEEGLIEETALHVASFMSALNRFDPAKHPRGRGGRFSQVLGRLAKAAEGDHQQFKRGVSVKKVGTQFHVHHNGSVVHKTSSLEDAARTVTTRESMRPPRPRSEPSKPRTAAPGIKSGARVEITTGPHRGKAGTVRTRSADGSTVIDGEDGKTYRMHQDALKPSQAKPSETQSTADWIRAHPGQVPPEAAAKAQATRASLAAEKGLPESERARLYQERRADLEKRASASVAGAAQRGKLSDAEAHFNDAGKVSQRTLATYVEEAGTRPQSIDLYSKIDSTSGQRVWDESRRQLHERIIGAYLRKRKIDPETGKPVLDFTEGGEDLTAHPDGPQVVFSGGGYAAGKGGVLKILGARGELPPDSFTLDPDQIKAELPEFQAAIGTDPEANMQVYREAWAIAQEIQARAMDRKLNIVVDGISDTSPEEMGQRARAFTSRGYKARAVYVDIPTEEAMKRAANRAINAKDDSDRRMIPSVIMRSVHRDVAATVPSLPDYLTEHQVPLGVEVWNNAQGTDENGQFRPPVPFFRYDPETGAKEVVDQALWDAFRNKGHEVLPGIGS